MIVFDRLWITMKEKKVSQYALIKQYGISTGQLDRLRKNGNVNTFTLNRLCEILNCSIEDIAEYVKEADESNIASE
ncbi:MAG: helix-turn-helix domain-containing protein [Acutalibacteraceae bacterium]